MKNLLFYILLLFSLTAGELHFKNLCGQLEKVSKDELHLPEENGRKWVPWELYPKAKIYRGDQLTKEWNFIKQQRIRGLNETVEGLIKYLHENHCYFFAHGGSVRSLVTGSRPPGVDGRVTCDFSRLNELCQLRYGREQCLQARYKTKLQISAGIISKSDSEPSVEDIDLLPWNCTFGVNSTHLEYSLNSLTIYVDPFEPNKVYLIDLIDALKDVCEGKIRIAAEEDEWNIWASISVNKVYRYLKAESAGFIPADHKNWEFITNFIQKTFDDHRKDFKVTKIFHCPHLRRSLSATIIFMAIFHIKMIHVITLCHYQNSRLRSLEN